MSGQTDRDSAFPGNQIQDRTICQQELNITNTPTDGQMIVINMPTGDFTAQDVPGGGGGSTSTFTRNFTNANLDGNDKINIDHNLNTSYPVVIVYDELENVILPTEITYVTDNQINLDFSGIAPLSGTYNVRVTGAGATTGQFIQTFDDDDLSSGILTANHNLGSKYVLVRIYDDSDKLIEADEYTATDENTLTIDLSSFTPLGTGNDWNIIISSGGAGGSGSTGSHTEEFDDADLDGSGDLIIDHNLDSQFNNVTIYNNLNEKIMPDKIIATSASRVTINLDSFSPLTGNWNIKVVG